MYEKWEKDLKQTRIIGSTVWRGHSAGRAIVNAVEK